MADYPGAETEQRFDPETLTELVAAIFVGCSMSAADARVLADSLVQADLRGIHSHGVMRVPDYVEKLISGGVDPRGVPAVVTDDQAALVVDCGNNMGQVGGAFAMGQAIDRARTTNIAAAAVRGSNHAGTMDYYVRMAIAEGMIGLATTNALPTMAPWGGTEKLIGLNPLGIGIPGGVEGPVVLDVALGETAHGKIRIYAQKGLPIPENWAFDKAGQPTTDAVAALDGLIQPIGAFKGLGLAMCMGILSSLLSGAAYGTESGNMIDGARPGADGQFYLAVNIAAFTDITAFKARIDKMIRQIRGSARAEGVERLYSPGEMEAAIAERNTAGGIPLNAETLKGLRDAAAKFGVTYAIEN